MKASWNGSLRGSQIAIVFALAITLSLMPTMQAQSYSVLYSFTGQSDGSTPLAGVTMDAAGNFYGTTLTGGQYDFGSVYRMVRSGSSWSFYPLYSFKGETLYTLDGAEPYSRVTIGPDGALYGTTFLGGNGQGCRELHGCGTVYKLQQNINGAWTEKMIFQFGYYDGFGPFYGDIVFDQGGSLYGTTRDGGANLLGAVYKLRPGDGEWAETVIHSFSGDDGSTPLNGPVIDVAGNLYGTTSAGGPNGWGTVYRLQGSGSTWDGSVLHSFQGGIDGMTASSGIVLDQAGNLYGDSEAAGSSGGGTVFELSPLSGGGWNFSTLFSFSSAAPGGCYRTLVMDSAGNLYGTSASGGARQRGSVFKLTSSNGGWIYTSLHDFTGGADGAYPYGVLSFDTYDNVYGTASAGGTYGNGVVFEITP